MDTNFIVIADCANLTADGKFNILGIFDRRAIFTVTRFRCAYDFCR